MRRVARVRAARRAAAAGVLLALVAACAGGSSGQAGPSRPPGRAQEPTAPADGGKIVLRIATGTDLTSSGIRRELIMEAAAEMENVEVRIVELPDDANRQRSQLVAALQAGNRVGYDIVNLDVTWTAEFAEQGLIVPLEGRLDVRDDADIWPSVRETVGYEEQAWAVPWNTDVGLLYYRADLLGPDPRVRTWDDLVKLSHNHRIGDTLKTGLVTQLENYEGLTVNTHEAVWRNGGEIVDEHGEVRVADPEAERGIEELVEAFAQQGTQLPVLDDGSLEGDESSTLERFLAGESLTMRNWPFAWFRLQEHLKKVDGDDTPEYGVMALPAGDGPDASGPGVLGGQNLAVTEDSPHHAAARRLIEKITDGAAACKLFRNGFVPARKSGMRAFCLPEGGTPGQGGPSAQYIDALHRSMEHARPRPSTPYYAEVSEDIRAVVDNALPDENDPPLGKLRDRLEKSLRGR